VQNLKIGSFRTFYDTIKIDKENLETEKNIIELMWETLQIEL